ncbi:MAG: hypothetical protein SGJ17_04890 [Hyphomicrobiales bacterium]|nr:hypothetical protein [Hyphomicrobiales bacterium]
MHFQNPKSVYAFLRACKAVCVPGVFDLGEHVMTVILFASEDENKLIKYFDKVAAAEIAAE